VRQLEGLWTGRETAGRGYGPVVRQLEGLWTGRETAGRGYGPVVRQVEWAIDLS